MAKVTWNGRPFDAQRFGSDLREKLLSHALEVMTERGRAAAASLVDPETGQRPFVFAWKTPPAGVRITTAGSKAFAMALEMRLDRNRRQPGEGAVEIPVVYFAHASEDKSAARPIAEHLLAQGIDVWFDEWEIGAGDSLRRKMDAGLEACTHFVVSLSPIALKKPWVNEEIDAGFVRRVEGAAKFIPLRLGLPLTELPPLLRGMLSPDIAPDNSPAMDSLVDQIHGVSAKPSLGTKPRYVQRLADLAHFSPAAIAIGKHLVSASQTGTAFDPQQDFDELAAATGLSPEDVEIGVLDLVEAGLVSESEVIGDTTTWPRGTLFVTFDPHVHDWRPAEDATTVAAAMVNLGAAEYTPATLNETLGWPARRMNAALHADEAAGLAECYNYADGGGWAVSELMVTAHTRRAARS